MPNRRLFQKLLMVSLLGVANAACSGGDDDDDAAQSYSIATTPLAGTVGGAPWTLVVAETDAFLSDETGFWAEAYSQQPDSACSIFGAEGPSILLTIPPTVGEHQLELFTLTATFVLGDEANTNLIATMGTIRVDSITDTEIRGGAYIEYDASNKVNGTFVATVCPE